MGLGSRFCKAFCLLAVVSLLLSVAFACATSTEKATVIPTTVGQAPKPAEATSTPKPTEKTTPTQLSHIQTVDWADSQVMCLT